MVVLISVLGAIIVATIAAVTAQVRLNKQLAHDRELRDLDELRALLDECAQAAGRTIRAYVKYGWFVRPDDLPTDSEADPLTGQVPRPQSAAELVETFTVENEPIFSLYQRVVLRLGAEHPISRAFLTVQGVASMALMVMEEDADPKEATDDDWEEWEGVLWSLREAHFRFLEASRRLVGSRIRGEIEPGPPPAPQVAAAAPPPAEGAPEAPAEPSPGAPEPAAGEDESDEQRPSA
jgi:hypothetical protein